MRAPDFWKTDRSMSKLLAPLGIAYGALSMLHARISKPCKVSIPVLCVGNAVAGGAGKTPVSMALHALLSANRENIFFLSRGYGGTLAGPLLIQPHHTARHVGDEALLLAAQGATIISRDRLRGATLASLHHAQMLIMDDGLQNHALHKDFSLLVVDGTYGFGNQKLLPAGPLRTPLTYLFSKVQAVVIMNEDRYGVASFIPATLPVFKARTEVMKGSGLAGQKVIGFAGIANPEKFHATLQTIGCDIIQFFGFSDHHTFSNHELTKLENAARSTHTMLVTTRKDWVRLPEHFRAKVKVVDIEARFEEPETLLALIRHYCPHIETVL